MRCLHGGHAQFAGSRVLPLTPCPSISHPVAVIEFALSAATSLLDLAERKLGLFFASDSIAAAGQQGHVGFGGGECDGAVIGGARARSAPTGCGHGPAAGFAPRPDPGFRGVFGDKNSIMRLGSLPGCIYRALSRGLASIRQFIVRVSGKNGRWKPAMQPTGQLVVVQPQGAMTP